MYHSTNDSRKGEGENLAWGRNSADPTYMTSTARATDNWYDEIKDYDFKKPTGFSMATGHFT